MKDSRLRELANQAYCDYMEQLKRPVCLGVDAKLKDGTFGKAELEGHVRAGELFGRHRALAEAAALASQPSDLRAKLEALRDKVANGIVSSQMREVSGDYDSGATDVEIAVEAALTAIIEGKD